jgi:hypothetical protein
MKTSKPIFISPPDYLKDNSWGFTAGRFYYVTEVFRTDPFHGMVFTVKNDFGNEISVFEKSSLFIEGNDFTVITLGEVISFLLVLFLVLGAVVLLLIYLF